MSALRAVLSSLPWLRSLILDPTSPPVPCCRDCVRVARVEQDLARLREALADRLGVIVP